MAMILPGCYNENLIDAVDINDPVDVALMVESENGILEDEFSDEELDAMISDVEAGIDVDENDDMFETSTDPVDVEIDEEIEAEYDLSDDIGELVDIVDGSVSQ